MSKVAVLGSGVVGQVLADGFLKHGYDVIRGTRDPAKLAEWQSKSGPKASVADFATAAKNADLVVLAVKGSAAEEAVKLTGPTNLANKTVIDTTNPIAPAPPTNGVLQYITGPNDSLMERLQKLAPEARLVKAFSSTGNANFVNPDFHGTRPSMFICGNDDTAKKEVTTILTQFGWDTEDLGKVEAARAIEPLCMLWCIPGFLNNSWTHAFKVLKR